MISLPQIQTAWHEGMIKWFSFLIVKAYIILRKFLPEMVKIQVGTLGYIPVWLLAPLHLREMQPLQFQGYLMSHSTGSVYWHTAWGNLLHGVRWVWSSKSPHALKQCSCKRSTCWMWHKMSSCSIPFFFSFLMAQSPQDDWQEHFRQYLKRTCKKVHRKNISQE